MWSWVLSVLVVSATASWETCSQQTPGRYSTWNTTACDTATSTCCISGFSVSKAGCCPYPNAVCCPNGYACCPSGTICNRVSGSSYGVVYNCTSKNYSNTTNLSVCKPGPALPMSTTLKNVLWIGDSLSIGMTPYLARAISDIALVQHAPWDTSDGGAEETAYSLHCLDGYLRSPSGIPVTGLDLIIVNFGMHDGPLGNNTVPGQNAPPTHYAEELHEIVARLFQYTQKNPRTKLVYALTTAFVCSQQSNGCVENLNNQARAIVAKYGLPIVDVYTPIMQKCGPIPNNACGGVTGAWCPHNPSGYSWLVETAVAPRVRELLK